MNIFYYQAEDNNRLLVGVTGGIASGKTTVANMLKDLGAPMIDFDVLARQVVEPGKPAWKDIVAYFGKQVLSDDQTLDRKKLSNIVFNDVEKRKKLESLTHPKIYELFVKQVNKISKKHPDAIIQAVIPLLIESGLQHLFHKTILVYIPAKCQIDRLAKRDKTSKKDAANILKAQLPIDEKRGHADFIINNEGLIDTTRQQVDALWQVLKKIQRKRAGSQKG